MITDKLNMPLRLSLEDSQIFGSLLPDQRVMFLGEANSWRYIGEENGTYCFVRNILDKNKLGLRGIDINGKEIRMGYNTEVDFTPKIKKEYARYSLQTGKYTSKHGNIRDIREVKK